MINMEFSREQKQRGVTPCWHCEPMVAPLRAALAWFTVAQRVGKLLLNVCWRAFGSLLPDTLQSRMSIFYRTEEVLTVRIERTTITKLHWVQEVYGGVRGSGLLPFTL